MKNKGYFIEVPSAKLEAQQSFLMKSPSVDSLILLRYGLSLAASDLW
jgi:hypothetical protein